MRWRFWRRKRRCPHGVPYVRELEQEPYWDKLCVCCRFVWGRFDDKCLACKEGEVAEMKKDYIAQYEGLPEHRDGVKLNLYTVKVIFYTSITSVSKKEALCAIQNYVKKWGINQEPVIELEDVLGVPLELQPKPEKDVD